MGFLATIGGLVGLALALVALLAVVVVMVFFGGMIVALIGAVFTMFFMIISVFFELFFTILGLCVFVAVAIAAMVLWQLLPAIALVACLAVLVVGVCHQLRTNPKWK